MTLLHKRLPWHEPADVAAVLACLYGEEGLIWLDGDGGELGGRITLAADPLEQQPWNDARVAADQQATQAKRKLQAALQSMPAKGQSLLQFKTPTN